MGVSGSARAPLARNGMGESACWMYGSASGRRRADDGVARDMFDVSPVSSSSPGERAPRATPPAAHAAGVVVVDPRTAGDVVYMMPGRAGDTPQRTGLTPSDLQSNSEWLR